jgi:hypothetical protein
MGEVQRHTRGMGVRKKQRWCSSRAGCWRQPVGHDTNTSCCALICLLHTVHISFLAIAAPFVLLSRPVKAGGCRAAAAMRRVGVVLLWLWSGKSRVELST